MKLDSVLYIDFECYSKVDLTARGSMRYARDPSTQILCMGYAFDDDAPIVWTPKDDTLPEDVRVHVEVGGKVYAHNMTFDFRIWNYIGHEQLGWPVLSLDQCIDSMAICQTYGVPASLAQAGEALGITMPKSAAGKALIKQLCMPDKNGIQPSPFGPLLTKFRELYEYCRRDIVAMRQIVHRLPRKVLIPREQLLWELTYEMNSYGLPVDVKTILAIVAAVEQHVERASLDIPRLSGGAFRTMGQVAKIREWCEVNGYTMDSLDAAAVKEGLKDPTCPPKVKKVLELRQELGSSSTAKYKKLKDLVYKGHVYDNLQFHGAAPGRWAGRGFQVHNLPRASVEDPEAYISCFHCDTESFGPDTQYVAKALIRPMIQAPPGYMLLVSDYSGIENRLLHWHAFDEEALIDFRNGIDQYKTMASARYHVDYKEVNKAQRQMGKVIILGCGYGMGKDKFKDTAYDQFGLVVSNEESALAVKAYREKYYKVKELWDGLKLAAVKCVLSGQKQTYNRITFGLSKVNGIVWLAMLLPSSKCIYYMGPSVEQLHIPGYEDMGRVPTITHWGVNPYSKKWSRLKLIPGRITENAVQGSAREVMGQGMLNVKERMPEVIQRATVHDEDISMIREDDIRPDTLGRFNDCLCDIPWADGLPLKAEGWIGKRYRK